METHNRLVGNATSYVKSIRDNHTVVFNRIKEIQALSVKNKAAAGKFKQRIQEAADRLRKERLEKVQPTFTATSLIEEYERHVGKMYCMCNVEEEVMWVPDIQRKTLDRLKTKSKPVLDRTRSSSELKRIEARKNRMKRNRSQRPRHVYLEDHLQDGIAAFWPSDSIE